MTAESNFQPDPKEVQEEAQEKVKKPNYSPDGMVAYGIEVLGGVVIYEEQDPLSLPQ